MAFDLCLTARTTLWDRDEPRFAQASVEMVRSGNYLYPTFRGEVRAQKPILIYWLMALSIGALGASEIAVRFWAPVGVAVTAYATCAIARRLISARAGLLAMLIVAVNPLTMLEGTAATTDAVLMALTTCAIAAFVWHMTSQARLAPALLFAVSLAAALLAKGPVGLLPLLVVAGTLVGRSITVRLKPDTTYEDPQYVVSAFRRTGTTVPQAASAFRRTRTIALEFGAAGMAGIALFAWWAIAANTATGGRFYSEGVEHDVIGRVLSPLEGHGGNVLLWLPFYPAVLLIGFAPWSMYVPAALHAIWRRDRERAHADRLLTWWIAGPFVAFSLAATHLPHYILPAWPALAIAVASLVDTAAGGALDRSTRRWIAVGVVLGVVTSIVAVAALIAVPFLVDAPGLMWRSLPIALALAAATVLFIRAARRADHARAFAVCATSAVLFQASMGFWWLPAIEQVKPVPRIAAMVHADAASTPIATFAFDEPSLDFYLGRTPLRLQTPALLRSWTAICQPGILVTTRGAMSEVERPASLREIGSARGINIANGRRLELVALARCVP